MEKISIKPGPTVEGNDFYGRKKELKYAWEQLISKGISIRLSAPRRVGKSSFSKKMLLLAEEDKWKTLYLDLQGIRTERDFVNLFKKELQSEKWLKKAGNTFLSIFDSIKDVEVLGNKIEIDTNIWRNNTYGKIKELIKSTDKILIVIDELTIYLGHLMAQEDGKEKVEFFLEWLRSFRQTTNARWIFCSSVGIENFASMHHLSKHLNDVYPFHIGAFSDAEAKEFISRLDVDEEIRFTEEETQYILDKLVWHLPYFIQILVSQIEFLVCVEGKKFSKALIDEAYNNLIAGVFFNPWDERLEYYYDLEANARKVLKLCVIPTGENRDNILAALVVKKSNTEKTEAIVAQLLKMLQDDGYLVENNGKYIFRSPLLRDFWYNRFIK